MVRLERAPGVEIAPLPAVAPTPPVDWMLGDSGSAPLPSLVAPKLGAVIAVILDEPGILGLRVKAKYDTLLAEIEKSERELQHEGGSLSVRDPNRIAGGVSL